MDYVILIKFIEVRNATFGTHNRTSQKEKPLIKMSL